MSSKKKSAKKRPVITQDIWASEVVKMILTDLEMAVCQSRVFPRPSRPEHCEMYGYGFANGMVEGLHAAKELINRIYLEPSKPVE
jgi:hypothetical protein